MPVVHVVFDDNCVGCNNGAYIHSNACSASEGE